MGDSLSHLDDLLLTFMNKGYTERPVELFEMHSFKIFFAALCVIFRSRSQSDGTSIPLTFPSRSINRTIFFLMRLNTTNVLADCSHFSIFIGSLLYQRAKPPLFINLLEKGLTPRAIMGTRALLFSAIPVSHQEQFLLASHSATEICPSH